LKQRMPMKNFTFPFFIKKIYFNSAHHINPNEEWGYNDMAVTGDGFFSPSEKTVRKIIDFAHSYDVVDTKSVGQVEMNLS